MNFPTSVDGVPGQLPICPDCRDGKHYACVGAAWDLETDEPTACRCWAENHEEQP